MPPGFNAQGFDLGRSDVRADMAVMMAVVMAVLGRLFGDLGEWRRAADGFLRADVRQGGAGCCGERREASATRTALGILELFVVVVPGARRVRLVPIGLGGPGSSSLVR